MSLALVNNTLYNEVRELYFLWKELNTRIKLMHTRGVNLPEAITEPICCYVNDFYWSSGRGSEDAIEQITNTKIQIKATSNFDRDLTSFGPRSAFDELHFVRLDKRTDKMYLYEIPIEDLANIEVNANETFRDQQNQNRRPRFSIILRYIEPYNIQPYAVVDLKSGEIEEF